LLVSWHEQFFNKIPLHVMESLLIQYLDHPAQIFQLPQSKCSSQYPFLPLFCHSTCDCSKSTANESSYIRNSLHDQCINNITISVLGWNFI
jgi:hypothetical protein